MSATISNPDLKKLMTQRRPGWSLERPFYTDAGIFATDVGVRNNPARHRICVEADRAVAKDYAESLVDTFAHPFVDLPQHFRRVE